MMYLSKGMLCKGSNRKNIYVRHFGLPVPLSGAEADAWLNGRLGFVTPVSLAHKKIVQGLVEKSLAVCVPQREALFQYWVLTRCVILPAQRLRIRFPPLKGMEKIVLIWVRKAGFNLSIAELIFLIEKGIKPGPELLYEKNRLALSKKIHPHCVLIANQFEHQMQHARYRDETVRAVMNLLSKKYLIIN